MGSGGIDGIAELILWFTDTFGTNGSSFSG